MLYIVATPIGNLGEISERAIEVLKSVSLIAAEDTRHSGILLKHLDIATPLMSYQKFNENACAAKLIEKLNAGEDVALISDAGMPLISDPGSVLVRKCIEKGLQSTVISGPCALINALILSGFSTVEFCFLGFLPDKPKLREEKIAPYKEVPSTLVFYSPPQSVLKDLDFLFKTLGERKAAVVRELTKKFEEVTRGNLGQEFNLTLKGEFVIAVEGFKKQLNAKSVVGLVDEFMQQGASKMEAIKMAAKAKGLPKSQIYKEIIEKDYSSKQR